MIDIVLAVLKYAWPWVLAATIWGVQETRIGVLKVSLSASHKREIVAQSLLDASRQRATDLALLWAATLPKIDDAARAQEVKDHAQIESLQQRVDELSRAPTLHFSGLAVGLFDDISTFANGRDAAPARASASGPAAVPFRPGAVYSEADIVEHDRLAGAAYRDAVSKLNECRNLYNEARNAQLKVNTP